MLFKLIVAKKETPGSTWEEKYEKDIKGLEEARKWGEDTIKNFNNTLHPYEKPRVLIDVVVLCENTIKDHDWHKTNLVTLEGKLGFYDKLKCSRCGITGKRYGLNNIIIDSEFKAKAYQRCDTALKRLQSEGKK